MHTNREIALQNMQALAENAYPGRGIVMGKSSAGDFVQVYWLMGRSSNSRNRKFLADGGNVQTEPLDHSKVENPSLIIYRAMADSGFWHIVSNGNQTDTVYNYFNKGGQNLSYALADTSHEPDAPNFTPRITGLVHALRSTYEFSKIIRRPRVNQEGTFSARFYYGYASVDKGYGLCLHTYNGDGNPLPSFDRDPYLVSLEGGINDIAGTYWELLNKENRVALAVKTIRPSYNTQEVKLIP